MIAVIAIRISGLALALFTLAFALLCDQLLFNFSWSGNGQQGIIVPRPQIGSINFLAGNPGDRYFVILATVILAICMIGVILIQKGTLGRFLSAMRGSPTAAESMGINLTKAKITVFALSAGVAGLGGALYGSLEGPISSTDFAYELSLAFVVVVITTGTFTVEGAVQAGMGFALFQFILDYPVFSRIQGIEFVLFAFGAFTYAKHPEGIVEFQKTRWMNRIARVLQRWDARRGRDDPRSRTASSRPRDTSPSRSEFPVADETLASRGHVDLETLRWDNRAPRHLHLDRARRDRRTRRPERRRQDDVVQLPERSASPGGGEHLVLRSAPRPHARLPQGPAGHREDLPAGGDLSGIDRLRALLGRRAGEEG